MLVATSTTTGRKTGSLRGIVTMLLAIRIGTMGLDYLLDKIILYKFTLHIIFLAARQKLVVTGLT